MKTPCSTVRYCAKSAYQLCLMTGLSSSSPARHYCTVWPNLGYVEVHGVELPNGDFEVRRIPIAKSWASL